jgi:hypothetical protein
MKSAGSRGLGALGVLVLTATLGTEACAGKSSSGETTHDGGGTPGASGSGSGGSAAAAGANATPSPSLCRGACSDTADRPSSLPSPKCPEAEPMPAGSCNQVDLECSYGDSPTPACRRLYQCQSEGWMLVSDAAHPCETAVDCPAAPVPGTDCIVSTPQTPCDYGDQLCYCTRAPDDLSVGVPGTWACFGAPMNPACPARLPNIGEGCARQALACDYAVNGCIAAPDSTVFCRDGAWEQGETLPCASK